MNTILICGLYQLILMGTYILLNIKPTLEGMITSGVILFICGLIWEWVLNNEWNKK